MEKYELLPQQLIRENVVTESDFFEPRSCSHEILLLTHSMDYLRKLESLEISRKEARKIGFPVRNDLIERGKVIAHGSLECAQIALGGEIALNIAGGTHHAFRDRGEGFCIFNDFAITANYLLHNHVVKQILIVDLDVHQGNGTASIFRDDDRVFTFSMHGNQHYPILKEQSDLDVAVPNGTTDEVYLDRLKQTLIPLIETLKPELILYLAGVDVLATDKLGKLALTPGGCYQRDAFVFESCAKYGIPVAVSMGGGYSKEIKHIVNAHANTYKAALSVFS